MAHIHEKIDFTIATFIVHKRSVLLVDHIKLKRWLPVGGHIELDEDPEQAYYREVFEETGLKREDLVLENEDQRLKLTSEGTRFLVTPSRLDLHRITDIHDHVGMIYYAMSKTQQVKLAEKEHNDLRWINLSELDDPEFNLSLAIKTYSKEAIERMGWD